MGGRGKVVGKGRIRKKVRKGKERKGKERKGKERKEKKEKERKRGQIPGFKNTRKKDTTKSAC